MPETPRQEALRRIAEAGADFEETSDEGLQADTWTPAGIAWRATGGHALTVSYYTDRPAGWRSLLEDLRLGTEPCTAEQCDVCGR